MKIVLISLYNYENIGIRTLHSFIQNNGHEVYSIYFKKLSFNNIILPTQREIQLLINKIRELKPDIIGINVNSSFFQLAKKLTKLIKNSINIPIIWGGAHPIICPEECIKEADYICRGEGEYPLLELLNSLSKNSKKENIKNIWVNKKNKIIKNDLRDLIDLNSISFPDWTNKDMCYIDDNIFEKKEDRELYYITTSRGCFFNCTFCCNNAFKTIYKGKGNYIRRRNKESIIKELIEAKKKFPKLNLIIFQDEVFTIDKKWVLDFAKEYKKKINTPFSICTHARFCDEKILSCLKEAGLIHMEIGIQSGSEHITKNIFKRPWMIDDIVNLSKIIKKYKISVEYHIIVDNPFETEKDKIDSLNILLKLERPFTLELFSLTFFPNTEIVDLAIKENKISKNDIEHIRQKAFSNWKVRFDLQGKKEDLFYNSLYILTPTSIPKFILIALSKSKFLKNHPEFVAKLRYVKLLNYTKPALKAIFSGDFGAIKRGINAIK